MRHLDATWFERHATGEQIHFVYLNFLPPINVTGQSQWPRGLKHELSSLALTLGSWVRIHIKAGMSAYCAFILYFMLLCVYVEAL
jgi:hypothetical protein